MKKLLDRLFTKDETPRNLSSVSALYGVETFYQCGKSAKKIVEPEHFEYPKFADYVSSESVSSDSTGLFPIANNLVDQGGVYTIIPTLEKEGLSGCGGAHFPVAVKWKAALANAGPRYLIVNGLEGEIQAFKDYSLMMNYPHLVVEGAAIAALALDVAEVVFVINFAYTQCHENIRQAIDDLSTTRYSQTGPGAKIKFTLVLGPESDFYVCGEETALLQFLENKRAEPQVKPPFPFQKGYKGQPSVIQNVETLCWVPVLLSQAQLNIEQDKLKLVQLSGAVNKPGIYEVKIDTPLYELLERAGGLKDGSILQAINVGGLAGGLLPPSCISLPFAHQKMMQQGAMIGSGSIRFMDQNDNLVEMVISAMQFFRDESCGRCTPCRVGTQELVRMAEILDIRGINDDESKWFDDITETMTNASICGLGKGAPTLFLSLLRYWQVENGQVVLKS